MKGKTLRDFRQEANVIVAAAATKKEVKRDLLKAYKRNKRRKRAD